jgi:predicted neuraminidase
MPFVARSLCAGLIAASAAFAVSVCAAQDRTAVLHTEFLFETPPVPSCHASTLAETPQGLVAAWFGGTYEKHPDVGIWFSRRTEQGWSTPREVVNGVQYTGVDGVVKRHPCWNPILFQSPGGPLLLFYKCGPNPDAWWGELIVSDDNGASWSVSRRLPEGIAGPVKNKAVLLADGRLLCPTSSEDDGWRVHFEWTSDLGRTWTRTGPLNDGKEIGAIQPSILQHSDGRLQAVGRSQQGKVYETWSSDAGKSWTPLKLTALPNPNSGTDAMTLADGRHLLVYNHTPKGRSPLNIALSADGVAWSGALVLESEPGEYSYPAVIQSADGKVHVSYTWKRKLIKHVVLDPAKFSAKPIVDGKWPD